MATSKAPFRKGTARPGERKLGGWPPQASFQTRDGTPANQRSPKHLQVAGTKCEAGLWDKGDFDEMVKHLPEHLQRFAKFAYHSGWHKGEISSLEWADVDMAAKAIQLRPENSKTNRARVGFGR